MIGGISILPNAPIDQIIEVVRHAEELGFYRCWVNDEGLSARDVFVVLAALAQSTARIRIGTCVTNPYTRHPGVTAAAIAGVDELSGGRAFLGIGAGGNLTLDPLGIERRAPLTAVREMVHITRRLLRGEQVTFNGSTVTLHGAALRYHRADLEIWIAGRGRKMVSLAGEVADGFAIGSIHEDVLGEVVATVRRQAREHARDTKICYSAFMVMDEGMLDGLRPMLTFSLIDTPPDVLARLEVGKEEINRLHQALREQGLEAASRLVRPEWANPYVLRGTATECAEQLQARLAQLEIDEFMVPITDWIRATAILTELSQALPLK